MPSSSGSQEADELQELRADIEETKAERRAMQKELDAADHLPRNDPKRLHLLEWLATVEERLTAQEQRMTLLLLRQSAGAQPAGVAAPTGGTEPLQQMLEATCQWFKSLAPGLLSAAGKGSDVGQSDVDSAAGSRARDQGGLRHRLVVPSGDGSDRRS